MHHHLSHGNSSTNSFANPTCRRNNKVFFLAALLSIASATSLSAAGTPPQITSGTAVTFPQSLYSTFTITTTGNPVPTISVSGHLPGGIKFHDNGNGTATLSGRPGSGQGLAKDYPITFTASNGVIPDAVQNFTLTISNPPRITSVNNATFVVGTAKTFTVNSLKTVPKTTFEYSGTLPAGITFVANNNGTATISGTATAGTEGVYSITITGKNGTLPNANQLFTLTVQDAVPIVRAPAFLSAATTTFTEGVEGTFTVRTTGLPTSTLSVTGTLPEWFTFIDNTDGTGTILGIPDLGGPASVTFTITAANGVSPDAVQSFTLMILKAPPAITSVDNAVFVQGTSNTFLVETNATDPISTLSFTGTLPSGVTFVPNSNGTATLSGTPGVGTVGNYPLVITASDGTPPDAVQNFTLTVQASPPVLVAPDITSSDTSTVKVGTHGTFTITTTGSPTSQITLTGPEPAWLTYVDNGDGTATLSGTPDADSDASYSFKITASNGVDPDASQTFVLVVNKAPAFISPASATFSVNIPGSFKVETTGNPIVSITKTGALPSGVTFVNNGDGTATIAGTPAAGTAGNYPITITATNGIVPNATQNFSLTISGGSSTPTPTPTVSPTPTISPTPTVSPTPTPTTSPSPSATATPTSSPTPSPSPSATPTTQLLNISTRLLIQGGNNVGIGGFIIAGVGSKTVLIRGLGPSLSAFISNPLQDPTLELHQGDSVIASNDDWQNASNADQIPSGFEPGDPRDSAILVSLNPGTYTVIEAGKDNVGGVGLLEIYDLDPPEDSALANISTRGLVGTAEQVMIGGFILGGATQESTVVVRAIGPSLTQFGIGNALADPTLELHNANGDLVQANNNWGDDPTQADELTTIGFAPGNALESAIVTTLSPGAYTAVVTGKDGGTGVALVELYKIL